uniref:DUF418 domain-containing protein n=1 Tax=Steinernema glaseri TaxID=37863 RepID=A0A1I7YWN1_9BILA
MLTHSLLILLSVKYVQPSLARTYILNISIPIVLCATCFVVRSVFDEQLQPFMEDDNYSFMMIYLFLLTVMFYVPMHLYEIQGTLVIILAYLSYTKPMKYRQLQNSFSKRNGLIGFLSGYLLIALLTIGVYFEQVHFLLDYSKTILRVHTALRFLIEMSIFSTMVVFYFKTLNEIFFKAWNNTGSSETVQNSRKRLRSVLIYCTSPSLFLIFGIVAFYQYRKAFVKLLEDIRRCLKQPQSALLGGNRLFTSRNLTMSQS